MNYHAFELRRERRYDEDIYEDIELSSQLSSIIIAVIYTKKNIQA